MIEAHEITTAKIHAASNIVQGYESRIAATDRKDNDVYEAAKRYLIAQFEAKVVSND